MTRGDVVQYLQFELGALAADAGIDTSNSVAGYAPAVDAALRAIGVTEALLAAPVILDGQIVDVLALAVYYALLKIQRALATRVDVAFFSPAQSKRRSQVFTQVKQLVEQARIDLIARGYLSGGITLGRLSFDFLEPDHEY